VWHKFVGDYSKKMSDDEIHAAGIQELIINKDAVKRYSKVFTKEYLEL
jgi:hypothetical protein